MTSQIKQSARDLIESIATETPIEFYDQALVQHDDLRKNIESLIDESRAFHSKTSTICRPYEGYCIFPYSKAPRQIHECLDSLEALASSLDLKHGAALRSYAIAAKSELAGCVDVDEIPASELLMRLRKLKKGCEQWIDVLKRKRDSLRQQPSAASMTRVQAIDIIKKTYDDLPQYDPETAMNKLVGVDAGVASFLRQSDWADLLQVSDRTIRDWSVWKRLKDFTNARRTSLKSTHSLAGERSVTDDAEVERINRDI